MIYKRKIRSFNSSYSQDDIVICEKKDAPALMKLHTGFLKEEVLPAGKELYMPSLLHDLEKILSTQTTIAIKGKDGFIGKAQTNAASPKFIQIGGVYTLPQYRKQGCAELLTKTISNQILSKDKFPILFVNKRNKPAVSLYKKCGFKAFGTFCVVYC